MFILSCAFWLGFVNCTREVQCEGGGRERERGETSNLVRFEYPNICPVVLNLVRPSQADQKSSRDIFDGPEIKGEQNQAEDEHKDKICEIGDEQINDQREHLEKEMEEGGNGVTEPKVIEKGEHASQLRRPGGRKGSHGRHGVRKMDV